MGLATGAKQGRFEGHRDAATLGNKAGLENGRTFLIFIMQKIDYLKNRFRYKTYIIFTLLIFFCCVNLSIAAGEDDIKIAQKESFVKKIWDKTTFNGWIETAQAVRTGDDHGMTVNRFQGRLEASLDLEKIFAHLSLDAEGNLETKSTSGVRVREAWLEHVEKHWDVRVGRQNIIWGKMDGVRITDNICPSDYADFMLRSNEDLHKPVWALKLRAFWEDVTAEFIWLPFFAGAELPETDSAWGLEMGFDRLPAGVGGRMEDETYPDSGLADASYAFKLSKSASGIDFSLSFLYGWDTSPSYSLSHIEMDRGMPTLWIRQDHHRMTVWGGDFSFPIGDFVIRGEAALLHGKRFTKSDLSLEKGDMIKYGAGVDWAPEGGWNVSVQIADEWIMNWRKCYAPDEHTPFASIIISKKFLNDNLTIKEQFYTYLHDGQTINRISAEYNFTDGLTGMVGFDYVSTDKDKKYAKYDNNTEVFFKLRYSF